MDNPTLAEVLTQALDDRAHQIRTALPAEVLSYNYSTQVVSVRPLVSPDGRDQPVVPNVPVCHLRGNTDSSYLAISLKAGDTGLLICCEADIREWRRTGQAGTAADAGRHHLTDSVFLPCLAPAARTLNHPMGSTVLAAMDLRLGSPTATDFVLTSTMPPDLSTLLTTLQAWGAAVDVKPPGPTGLWAAVVAAIATLQAGIGAGTYQTTNTKAA